MPGRPWTLLPTPGAVRHQGVFAPFSRLYGSRRRAGTDVFFMQKEEEKMKKRALSLLMAFVMVVGLLPTAAWAAENQAEPQDGPPQIAVQATDETAVDITEDVSVSSKEELAELGGKTVAANITLTGNIDMTGVDMEPIKSLTGCFDGGGYTISNLTLKGGTGSSNWQGTNYVNTGLIGELNGSIINVKMTGVSITENIGNWNNIGALVGKIADNSNSRIDNCVVSGAIGSSSSSSNTFIGGLVGYVTGTSALVINNCLSNVTLTCGNSGYAGGLLGAATYFVGTISVKNAAVLGNITSGKCGGGIVGCFNGGSPKLTVNNSYVAGTMSGNKVGAVAYCGYLSSYTVELTDFSYDSTKNSDKSFQILPTNKSSENSYTGSVNKLSTDALITKLTDFEVSEDFGGYPVPKWTPVDKDGIPKPVEPPFSGTLTFTGTEGGTLIVRDPKGNDVPANVDGSYTLSSAGDYTYTLTFNADSIYRDITDGRFTVLKTETEKAIAVTLTYKTTEPSGTGTKESPYLIGTAEELRWFAERVNALDTAAAKAYVKLTKNIEVPGSWTPLGKNAKFPFSGHFDGDGKSVTITVDNPGLSYFGFFGCLDSKVDRDSATSIDDQPTVVVENLTVNGTVYCSEPYAHVGGIAGCARGKVEIKNCVNNATVSSLARGSAGVGGLVGGYDDGVEYVYWNICMTLTDCANNGPIIVTGDNEKAFVGGMVGANANCVQLTNCTNTGTVNAPGCTVGGLLGEAGAQTGDFVPTIKDSSNSGVLLGAAGKTNNLYGKGTIRSGYLINSGSNTYTGGSESEDELLKESRMYNDVLAVPAGAVVGDTVTLLKSGETAGEGIAVTCSVGERDTNRAYLEVVDGKLRLAKKNETGKVIEATATITWSKDGRTLSKPVTVNLYPAASSRKTLMNSIAATYTNSSSDWVVFDMAAYAKCGFGSNTTDTENYLNLTINELAGTSPLATDRTKAEIILAALGIDSTRLTPLGGAEYSNAAKLAAMNLGTSHYTAPWVLLAEQAGQMKLSDKQRSSMISLLTSSLGPDGLFVTKWAGETYADPDTTGTALTALAAYADRAAVKSFIDKAVAGLSKAQNSNGSYGNVNSDAMVIIGLAAVGIDPASDERFVKGGCSLADALLLYVNDGQNGFTAGYISGTQGEKAQALATEQGFRALVTLEQFAKDTSKAFNIYTLSTAPVSSTDPDNPDTPGQPAQPEQPQPGTATGSGTLPSEGGSTGGGSTGSSGKSWISVAVSIEPGSGSAWYSGSVRVAEGATVEQALETAAAQAGLILNIKDGYLRAVIRSGVTLGQYDEGPNSGWLYKVNGKAPNVGIADYRLNGGETVTVYYTADYTKESGLDISAPASGGAVGKTETVTNADGSVTKIETKSDGTVIETTTWRDGSTLTAETSPNGRVETVEKRADGTTVETVESVSGEITASVSVPKSVGSTRVDIPVSKPTGSMVAVIVHPDGTEEIVRGSVVTETGIALRAEGDVRLKIIDNAKRFNDMADHWAKDAVEFASSRELFNGVGNDAFGPDRSMTRGMVNTVLARLAGADTAGGETWYAKGTAWAVENGISDGTAPEQPVTREQLAAMLYRYAGSPAVSGELSFDDTAVISIWAYDAVRWCVDNGILNGVGGNRMTPQDLARRGQVAAMLMRFLQATV